MFDFNVENIEYVVMRSYKPSSKYNISQKKAYRLVYILEGKASFIFQDRTVETKKGDVLFLAPDNNHDVITSRDDVYSFITIAFNANIKIDFSILKSEELDNMEEVFKKSYYYFDTNDVCKALYLKSYVYLIASNIIKNNDLSLYSNKKIERVMRFIQQNYCKKITLDELSKLSGYSLAHFKKIFFEQCGTSPLKYINNLRIEKAKNMLISDMFSISEIADSCGFENLYYFSNAFKKHTGMSPTDYFRAKNGQ